MRRSRRVVVESIGSFGQSNIIAGVVGSEALQSSAKTAVGVDGTGYHGYGDGRRRKRQRVVLVGERLPPFAMKAAGVKRRWRRCYERRRRRGGWRNMTKDIGFEAVGGDGRIEFGGLDEEMGGVSARAAGW
jgi:hypothetical protein